MLQDLTDEMRADNALRRELEQQLIADSVQETLNVQTGTLHGDVIMVGNAEETYASVVKLKEEAEKRTRCINDEPEPEERRVASQQ